MTDDRTSSPTTPTSVSVIGLGAMGSALASTFVDAGFDTTVWNRTAGRADGLVARGARGAGDLAEAFTASDVVVLCVVNHEAARAVLAAAPPSDGRVVVNLTNGTPQEAESFAAAARDRGHAVLDGGIMAVPELIGGPHAFVLYSGPREAYDAAREVLTVLGRPVYVSDDDGAASLYDLSLLAGMYGMLGGFFHAAALVRSAGHGVESFTDELLVPWLSAMLGTLPESARSIDRGDYAETGSPLAMQVANDSIGEASAAQGVSAELYAPLHALMQRRVDDGHGAEDMAGVVELLHSRGAAAPPRSRSSVTVLGMGPMGRALAGTLVAAGHEVTVWNRTPGRAGDLVRDGAREASSVAEAMAASEVTLVSVIDDAAAREILEAAGPALSAATVVNLTADTPRRARGLADWASERGSAYLDGAVMTPTATIGGPAALVLVSGRHDVFARVAEVLETLAGTVTWLGEDPGRASAYDVALLDLFWTTVNGYAHALALARAEGVAPSDLAPYASGIVAIMDAVVPEMAAELEAGAYPGEDASVASAAATMTHVVEVSREHRIDGSVIEAAATLAAKVVADGHGGEGISRLAASLGAGAGHPQPR
ncbi:NAD(P)-dependent oxidoreductase [Mumia zhuanghuii]|uniref:NAD(P)-dependent oxidoreductase n=2 Tax=Mumia TaxID=1546255 RepID=A0ABW1QJ02_9ACTN|nr:MULTISPECIES: NAD(P)-binding domain-containing protein [Mumia]KAA1424606.1 NAD(P)-dependent oxidoreductase [Mumia zhuanghuii]